ncbi:MAG TPA: response regulator [Anaerolineales bacterium]|nr:response regulator [Anaerolineales bacterium]
MDPISILVVDDEPGIALLCKRMLSRAGYLATALTDPRAALEWLQQNKADLLLVDIRMPEIDGFEVITAARGLQPDLAVLVMTGFGTVETAIRALRQGVDGLLLKPFEKSTELLEAVKQAMADSRQKRDAARVHALRPLFEVTESLLSETRSESLLELIINAILGHLRSTHAGYFQYAPDEQRFILLHGQGIALADFIIQVDAGGAPLMLNASGPGEASAQARLQKAGLGGVIFVPIVRQGFRGVFYAGRNPEEHPFVEADLDMFQILARQAAASIENAHLYDEQRAYVRKIEESQNALLQAEKMAAAGRLSASIAHEVNNPLQSVQNCLHLAGREDLDPEKRKEYFEMASSELERLSTTVQRMLDFYRPGAARPREVRISELLAYVISLTAKQLTERGIHVKNEVPAALPSVMAVSSQIQQVFINLILNAYDAMPNGGNLRITGRSKAEGVELLFQDSGRGVPREQQSSIFEPFFSTKDGGTGLGLTVSYNIITAHGGILELVPDHGKGACFRVFLPKGEPA